MSENKDPRLVDGIEEVREIPPLTAAEINRLWQQVQLARETFASYVKTVRLYLGIPERNTPDNYWDLSDNAQFFLRISDPQAAILNTNTAPAQSAAPTKEETAVGHAASGGGCAVCDYATCQCLTNKQDIPDGEDHGDVCDQTYNVERPRANP